MDSLETELQSLDDRPNGNNGASSSKSDSAALARDEFGLCHDTETLARLGKKQVFKRNFGLISMLSFSCTILVTWEAVLVLFSSGFQNGGPPGLVYQYLLIWGGTFSTFLSIGELASMAPTAGGQYHWVALLAPRPVRNFLSYVTGWMTLLAWLATLATAAFLGATQTQGAIALNHPDYVPQGWHGTLMTWAVILICVFVTTVVSNNLPKIETAFMILHILGFFAILVPLVYFADHGSAEEVFSTYLNEGGWPTYGLSFMVGTLGLAFAFVGGDAAVHMSEEIENASLNVPRSIVLSIVINGALGFGILLAAIFCLGDVDFVLQAQAEWEYAYMGVFYQAVGAGGTTGMAAILTALAFTSSVGFVATSSRMIWSFARDKGLPFSDALSKVNKGSSVPYWAVFIAAFVPCLLALINIGSTVAFNDVTSLALVGFYSTYFISILLLLFRRLKGDIREPTRNLLQSGARFDEQTGEFVLMWGPWRVPGYFGPANNILSLAYLFTIWFFGFWPPATPVDATTMSYSSVVFGAVVLYSVFYYLVWGRKQYKGPIVETTMPDYIRGMSVSHLQGWQVTRDP